MEVIKVTRLDETNTMASKSLLYFQNSRFYRPKTVLENFGILTPSDLNFDLRQKKWPIWFRNYFSRAFERRFPFCSTIYRSRDRRGVFKHPPSGGGKSRGPSGRGLKLNRTFRNWRIQGRTAGAIALLISPPQPNSPWTGEATEISPSQMSLNLMIILGGGWKNGMKNSIFYSFFLFPSCGSNLS